MAEAQTYTPADIENKKDSESKKSLLELILSELQQIRDARAQKKPDTILEAKVKGSLSAFLKEHLPNLQSTSQEIVRRMALNKGEITSDDIEDSSNFQKIIQTVVEAHKLNLVEPPKDKDTNTLFETIMQRFVDQGVSRRDAVLFEPIINGIQNRSEYVRFSKAGEDLTPFEQDLKNLLRSRSTEVALHDYIAPLISQKKLENITAEQFKEKINQLKKDIQPADATVQELTAENLKKRYEAYKTRLMDVSKGERNDLNQRRTELDKKIEQIEQNTSLTDDERERELNPLKKERSNLNNSFIDAYPKQSAVLDYLQSDPRSENPIISPPFNSEEEIINYLHQAGFSDAEIAEMKQIFPSLAGNREGRTLGYNTGYEALGEKISTKYSSEKLYHRLTESLTDSTTQLDNNVILIESLERLQSELEDDIGILFDILNNSPKSDFQEAFSPYSEGQMHRNIVQYLRTEFDKLSSKLAKEKAEKVGKPGTEEFDNTYRLQKTSADRLFRDKVISVIQRRPTIEAIVHQYQQQGATIDLQNLQNIYKKYDVSTLQEFNNDKLTRTLSDLMIEFLLKKQLENGNEVITDLFQLVQDERKMEPNIVKTREGTDNYSYQTLVVKYKDECIKYMKQTLDGLHATGNLDYEVSEDQISSRFSRIYLDNFLLSLRGIKVLARANPMHADFKDVPYGTIITEVFNPMHDWPTYGMRGRGGPREGAAQGSEWVGVRNIMFNEAKHEEWRKKHGDIFDDFHPQEILERGQQIALYRIYPDNAELMKDLRSGRWDVFQTMRDAHRGLAVGNIIDQGGWPFSAFMNKTVINEVNKLKDSQGNNLNWDNLDFNQKLDAISRTAGVIPSFWFVGGEVGANTSAQFDRFIARHAIQEARSKGSTLSDGEIIARHRLTIGKQEYDKLLDEYTVDKKRFEKIYSVKFGNKETNVSHREYSLHREMALRGKVFHQLLLKDSLAWLGEMTQTFPELSKGYITYTDRNNVKRNVLASDFYFNLNQYPDSEISKEDKENRDRFRFEVLTKFRGREEDDYMSNVPHIKKIMDFYANLYLKYKPRDLTIGNTARLTDDEMKVINDVQGEARSAMFTQLSIGHKSAVAKKASRIDPVDVIKHKNGQPDTRIHDLMYAEDGLVTHFENMISAKDNYFGDGENDLGEENGFYQRWAYSYKQANKNTLPEGDTNMEEILRDAENKQSLDRRLATNMTFAKAKEVLGKVPSTCLDAADSENFDQWYGNIEKLHQEMKELEGEDEGIEQRYQMNLYVAVCNYFSLDSNIERIFTGYLEEMKLGNKKSLASIKADYSNKFMLDADARRTYLKQLREKSYIKKGYDTLWGGSVDTIERMAGVSAFEIYWKQFVLAAIGTAIFVVGYAAKEGFEDEMDDD